MINTRDCLRVLSRSTRKNYFLWQGKCLDVSENGGRNLDSNFSSASEPSETLEHTMMLAEKMRPWNIESHSSYFNLRLGIKSGMFSMTRRAVQCSLRLLTIFFMARPRNQKQPNRFSCLIPINKFYGSGDTTWGEQPFICIINILSRPNEGMTKLRRNFLRAGRALTII